MEREWKKHFFIETKEEHNVMYLVVKVFSPKKYEDNSVITLCLTNQEGNKVLQEETVWKGEEIKFECRDVILWDCEHPYLYQGEISLLEEGKIVVTENVSVGFRTVEKRGKQILWNHTPLKLKGICYRERGDISETKKDLLLFAEANINYIRSIYGDFTHEMLSLCDEMGFLVENTAPFYHIGLEKAATQDLPHYKEEYLKLTADMLEQGNHVSILIWSLGHDCAWGSNFREAYRLIREMDCHRPITFHLPMSIPEEETQMDIWPVHFIDYKQPFDVCYDQMEIFHTPGANNEIGYMTGCAKEMEVPVLHEVWSPIACHNREEIERDPSIQEFWGESIQRFVEKAHIQEGCLGGAILAGVDEDGSFEELKGYSWGILDVNHQKKPEYFHVKMAYHPVFLTDMIEHKSFLALVIENRFLYSDLSEVTVWIDGCEYPEIRMKGKPGDIVTLEIPFDNMAKEEESVISFTNGNRSYGEYVWRKHQNSQRMDREVKKEEADPFAISSSSESIIIKNSVYTYIFSNKTGMLQEAFAGSSRVLAGGPVLLASRYMLGECELRDIKAETVGKHKKEVKVTISGHYHNSADITVTLHIKSNGILETEYEVSKLYRPMPHTVKAGYGMDPGGLSEKGISYLLDNGMAEFAWEREAGWYCYPSLKNGGDYDHIGRSHGEVSLKEKEAKDDLFGTKHHLSWAKIIREDESGVHILSDGSDSIRLEPGPELTKESIVNDRDPRMEYQGTWYPMDDYCGNYLGTETVSDEAGSNMILSFNGTGISLFGGSDVIYGKCDVYIDGEKQGESVCQSPDKVDFPGMSRGYEKRYGCLVFQIDGLEEGKHTLQVMVKGEGYTSIDYAVIRGEAYSSGTRMLVMQDYNYPRLVRGCYKRPKVELIPGVKEGFQMRLIPPMKKEGEKE